MHEIEKWLKDSDNWKVGLMLYSKYGRFKSVLTTFEVIGENKATIASLKEHLKKELAHIQAQEVLHVAEASNLPAIITTAQTLAAGIDTAPLQLKANQLYAQMGSLHARLLAVNTDEFRKELVTDLLQLQKQWVILMRQIDNPELAAPLTDGRAPLAVSPEKKETNAKNLAGHELQQLLNLRSKVTRAEREQIPAYRAKLAKGDNKKVSEKLKNRLRELAAWKKRIEELETVTNGKETAGSIS